MTQDPPLCEIIVNLSYHPVEGYFNSLSCDTWIQKIWKEGIDFDHCTCLENWFMGKSMIGLLALKYFLIFVVQTDSSSGSTEVYFFDPSVLSGVRVTYIGGATGQYHKPLPGSVCLVYDGATHWIYMTLSKNITFPEKSLLRWDFWRIQILLCSSMAMSMLVVWGTKKSCRSIWPRSGNHSQSNLIVRGDVIAYLCYRHITPFARCVIYYNMQPHVRIWTHTSSLRKKL